MKYKGLPETLWVENDKSFINVVYTKLYELSQIVVERGVLIEKLQLDIAKLKNIEDNFEGGNKNV